MEKNTSRSHRFYLLAIGIKAFDGIVQVIVATLIFVFGPEYVSSAAAKTVTHFAKRELDPDSSLLFLLLRWAENLSPHSATLAAIYLLAHGAIKLILVAALLTQKLWTYPIAIGTLLLFMVYEVERIYRTHSLLLSCAAALDLVIVILIARELREKLGLF